MCGILGVFNLNSKVDAARFDESLELLKHRGPDFRMAKKVDDFVTLGHARLSIIDLSSSNNQPFSVDDRYSLTYNGEVYNYLEIKEELKAKGVVFTTSGDTEVVLQSYKVWGEDCVKRFNGMWAFAIYDKELKRLFCSRDRFGVKPFSYFFSEDEFIFSSEIKPIIKYRPEIKEPNYNVIANFVYKSTGAQISETWFKNVWRLQPAHNLIYQNGKLTMYRYWEYQEKTNTDLSFEEAKLEFEKIFVDAVNIRMRSDVKVGSTLSSGLDSSSIVGVLTKSHPETIETFTAFSSDSSFTRKDKGDLKQDVDLNESNVVRSLAKEFNVNVNLIEVSFENYVQQLSETIYFLESGHSSPATVCIHQVYKEARKKIKVLLEGQGADELLGGYIVEGFSLYIKENLKRGKFKKSFREFNVFRKSYSLKSLGMLFLRSLDNPILNSAKNVLFGIDVFNKGVFKFTYLKDTPQKKMNFDQKFNKYLYNKHTSGLVNLLHYGDALSMAESIECRLPFMDYRLVEFAFSLPYDFKVNEMQGKYIQRKALEKYIPEYISKSLIKIGFATPLDRLITESKEVEKLLLNDNCGDLFNNKNIEKLLNNHRNGKENHSTLLFRILSAKIWYKIFFSDK
jgi:asparagine synthase (glutamine-hydrolysing)